MILIFFLSFLLAFVLAQINFNVKNIPKKTIQNSAKCALLLTMHCTTEKLYMYLDVLNLWLNKSNFLIYTVDSANHPMFKTSNHPRWRALSFDQGIDTGPCYSILELNAIARSEKYFDWSQHDLVIKVTGKYFLPNLENIISYIPNDTHLVLQRKSNVFIKYQNSELYAFKPGYAQKLQKNFNGKGSEQSLYEFAKRCKEKCLRFPSLKIETKNPRGDGSVLSYL